jgi:chemotaxis protein methyltransferase CheR
MDIIMLRNALIYFDEEAKKQILARVAKLLAPDGYLVLGGSETPVYANNLFERYCSEGSGAYTLRRA